MHSESTFRKISTSLLYYARANPEFRERLHRALGRKSAETPPSFSSRCEAFAAVLYHTSCGAAEEDIPEEDIPEEDVPEEGFSEEDYSEESRTEEGRLKDTIPKKTISETTIPETVEAGTFAPDDIRPEDTGPEDTGPEDISEGEERPDTVLRPTRLQELIGSVAYNSDLPEEQTAGVEAAVAYLVLDR